MWFFWSLVATANASLQPIPCDTLHQLSVAPPYQAVDVPGDRVDGKGQRDAFNEAFSNTFTTSNFVIKWGGSESFSQSEIENLANSFEKAWTIEVDEMGHEPPDGTSQYLFNIYIGNTGENTPDIENASGYFTLDSMGWPMIVMQPDVVRWGDYASKVSAHEWYHALQYQSQQFEYSGLGAWFWEASANWAASQVHPEYIHYLNHFFAAHLMFPHYPVDFFDYPDSGSLQEYYQYGAALLPMYLSDALDDWTVIADIWKHSSHGKSPLYRLAEEVELRGESFDTLWLDMVAHSATVDFAPEWQVWTGLEAMQGYPEYSNLTVRQVPIEGDTEWIPVAEDVRPMRYGYNTLHVRKLGEGTLNIRVRGDASGDLGALANWGARVVIFSDTNTYLEMPFDENEGLLSLALTGDEKRLWLVVAPMTEDLMTPQWDRETFGYETLFEWEQPPEPPPPIKAEPNYEEEVAGCACQSSAVGIHGAWLLLPIFWRRRQR